ncbi:LytR/AlgR family response regulator transcription factor [Chitinophagaceae bacterium MMS25-I14]
MQCLIIDDEPLAQDVIEHYVLQTNTLQLAGKCSNALEAFSMLSKNDIDLVFLDIQMPEINGLEFIRTLRNPPKIILTTAYPEFALEGYELDVVDYLLKPVSFERFLKAVDKARASSAVPGQAVPDNVVSSAELFVKTDGKLIRIDPKEILFVEGLKNYLAIYCTNRKLIVHSTMKNMEIELLSYGHFIRVHKSYIANTKFITEIEGNMIKVGQHEVPVGGIYKDDILRAIKII